MGSGGRVRAVSVVRVIGLSPSRRLRRCTGLRSTREPSPAAVRVWNFVWYNLICCHYPMEFCMVQSDMLPLSN